MGVGEMMTTILEGLNLMLEAKEEKSVTGNVGSQMLGGENFTVPNAEDCRGQSKQKIKL